MGYNWPHIKVATQSLSDSSNLPASTAFVNTYVASYLSTWPGSENVTTLGTVTTGTWSATQISDDYIASAATWNGKQDSYSILTTFGELANAVGVLNNDGFGNLSWEESTGGVTEHNDLTGIQGGTTGDFQHLTSSQLAIATQEASLAQDGYLTTANFAEFNSKQDAYTNLTTIGSLANAEGWLHNNGAGVFSYSTPTKSDVGLGNVENTALSTWTGTVTQNTLGTVTTGMWNATPIEDSYIASSSTWNGKQTHYDILDEFGGLSNGAGVLTNDGSGNLSWEEAGSGPGGLPSRDTVEFVLTSLTSMGTTTGTASVPSGCNVIKIVADYPCRVRLYGSEAARTADASRGIKARPSPGSGVYGDFYLYTTLTRWVSPRIGFENNDTPTADILYYSATNMDTSTRTITVTITYVPTEA